MKLDPDTRTVLALGAAGASIVLAARLRADAASGLVMLLGFGIAQWLVTSAHDQRFPEIPAKRLERALEARRDWLGG